MKTHLEIDRNIHMTSATTTDESPGSTRGYIPSGGKVRGSEGVYHLVDARPVERDLVVVGITEMSERELVVTALVWLESNFATGTADGLDQLARGLLVLLRLIIYLEGAGTAENERSRDTCVAGASERLRILHTSLENHSPLVDLLPFDLCAGEGHLDDLARFRA